MAYTAFQATQPAGSQTGPNFATSANANDTSLRDAILMGQMPGFVFSVSGGTAAQPTSMFWKHGSGYWLRATVTWGSGAGQDGNITQIVWDLSINSGSDYTTAPGGNICTETFTYDTSSNLTATTGAGGLASWLQSYMGKWYKTNADYTTHAAATGSAVHGLGTISTQSAAAVAITGGSVSCTYEREAKTALGSYNASTGINWALGGHFTGTITGGSAAHTFSNLPNGTVGYVTLELTNPGLSTFSNLFPSVLKAGGSTPSMSSAGKDIFVLMCHDGATVHLVGNLKAMA